MAALLGACESLAPLKAVACCSGGVRSRQGLAKVSEDEAFVRVFPKNVVLNVVTQRGALLLALPAA